MYTLLKLNNIQLQNEGTYTCIWKKYNQLYYDEVVLEVRSKLLVRYVQVVWILLDAELSLKDALLSDDEAEPRSENNQPSYDGAVLPPVLNLPVCLPLVLYPTVLPYNYQRN